MFALLYNRILLRNKMEWIADSWHNMNGSQRYCVNSDKKQRELHVIRLPLKQQNYKSESE
jgi:hypothetical protein